jgi:hypothetical protein
VLKVKLGTFIPVNPESMKEISSNNPETEIFKTLFWIKQKLTPLNNPKLPVTLIGQQLTDLKNFLSVLGPEDLEI